MASYEDLVRQLQEKDERLKEKDERLKEKDERLKENDERLEKQDKLLEKNDDEIKRLSTAKRPSSRDSAGSAMADYGMQYATTAFEGTEKTAPDGTSPSHALMRTILDYNAAYVNERVYMAPYVSIACSTGNGKSYAMYQLASKHNVYVVYACLASAESTAVPGRTALATLLDDIQTPNQAYNFWLTYLFLGECLIEVAIQLEVSPSYLFRLQWKPEFVEFQGSFAELLASLARSQIDQVKDIHKTDLLNKIRALLNKVKSLSDTATQNDGWKLGLKKMHIFCLDEAHGLLRDVPHSDDAYNQSRSHSEQDGPGGENQVPFLFDAFRKALRESHTLSDQGPFGILLDTTSRITNFAPQRLNDPSQQRAAADRTKLFRPVYYLDTWDVQRSDADLSLSLPSLKEAVDSLASLRHIHLLFGFGRPLWAAIMDAARQNALDRGKSEKEALCTAIIEAIRLAQSKMNPKKDGNTNYDVERSVALISYRLQFRIDNQKLAEELVANWMHIIYYMPESREYIWVVQPSEPILAYTTVIAMQKAEDRLQIIRQFAAVYTKGLVNPGDQGEIVAALLLLFAADNLQRGVQFPAAFPLSAFIQSLTGPETDATKSLTDDEHHVFFNHFGRHYGDVTENVLSLCYRRGRALILPPNFPGGDLLIPLYNSATGKISALVIQVKNIKRHNPSQGTMQRARMAMDDCLDEIEFLKDRPTFGVYMSLRGGKSQDGKYTVLEKKTKRKRTRSGAEKAGGSSTPMSWLLVQSGFDAEVYPCLCQEALPCEAEMMIVEALAGLLKRGDDPFVPDDSIVEAKRVLGVTDGKGKEKHDA